MTHPFWYRVLETIRKVSPKKRAFTAIDLASYLGLSGEGGVKIASKWLHKLTRWGYLEVVRTEPGRGNRPRNVCMLTKKGKDCVPKVGRLGRIEQLLNAIGDLKEARGTRGERAAMDELFKVAEESVE